MKDVRLKRAFARDVDSLAARHSYGPFPAQRWNARLNALGFV
jgi:hypothetical protein